MKFKALQAYESENGLYDQQIVENDTENLPQGEVLIHVLYSSLNYKDALSATGNKGVTRKYPFVPGIDAAGFVASSTSHRFHEGDQVLVTGYDLGMNTSGGFGQYIRVPAGWVVPIPFGLSMKHTMALGTAGFTAALSIYRLLQNGMTSDQGEVLVTGATGGVGSFSVLLLNHLGYQGVAATTKADKNEYLTEIGASSIINTAELKDDTQRNLLSSRWANAIDTVGGDILSTVIRSVRSHGNVAVCGLVNSSKLELTVFPLIIRGVSLLGINSAETPYQLRSHIWQNLSSIWKAEIPESLVTEIPLIKLKEYIQLILKGGLTGRVLVNLTDIPS